VTSGHAIAAIHPAADREVRLGLRENLAQFSLLVLVNAFVGGMVGLERTVVPLVGGLRVARRRNGDGVSGVAGGSWRCGPPDVAGDIARRVSILA
jgi:hypothetical protein